LKKKKEEMRKQKQTALEMQYDQEFSKQQIM